MRHRRWNGTRRPLRRPGDAPLRGRPGPGPARLAGQLRQRRERELARKRRARRWQAYLRWFILRPLRLFLARTWLGRRLAAWLGIEARPAGASCIATVHDMRQEASD